MKNSMLKDFFEVLDEVLDEHATGNQKLLIYLDVAKKLRDRQKDAEDSGYPPAVEDERKNDKSYKFDF